MKRRIRSIFWLMVVCMVGINGFQAYWLYSTYQLTATEFSRTAREALQSVVQRYQLGIAQQYVNKLPPSKTKMVVFENFDNDGRRFDRVVVRARPDSAPAARRFVVVQHELKKELSGPARQEAADTLVHKLSRMLAQSWAGGPIDMKQLTADYRAEMKLRGADTELVLDTLRAGLRHDTTSTMLFGEQPVRAGFRLQTPPVSLNPFRDLYVWAAFKAPTSYILQRMGGLLAGSVLLLALTTACFLLMLNTILRQKRLSDVKNDFINNMTHELKTPLATVSAAVEALQNFGALQDPQKTQTYLSISRNELQRLSDLVEKVLKIAVEESQPLELRPEAVLPAELVADIVARHQLQATKPVAFDVELPAGAMRCDRLHMGNVINNLIDNAIKYSPEQVTITIRGGQEDAGWRLTVADDGPGIAPTYQEAIFDRFFRVPTGNLHPVKGFGLGLYYVRQVIERHGGRIAVRSGLGRGSEFSLWIPN
jgi:two-component system phosphate regulon sensor histidine kinase PhoR